MFVVVVNISNINYSNNVSYNLFLLPGTKKADETKVHPEFSRYNVCISKFCFHFLKEVMCFSNIAIWQSGHKNNWTQWPLAISPNLIYSSFSSCVPTNDVLVPSPLFSPKLSVKKKKRKTLQQHHNLLSLPHIKLLLMFHFHYVPNCTLGHC